MLYADLLNNRITERRSRSRRTNIAFPVIPRAFGMFTMNGPCNSQQVRFLDARGPHHLPAPMLLWVAQANGSPSALSG